MRELDRQLELLRRVHRIERERALRLAQRATEIAEVREREAQIVVGFGEIGVGLDRAGERVASVRIFVELDEYQTDAVPRDWVLRGGTQHLAVRFERELGVLSPEQSQREVEARFNWRCGRLKRAPESVDCALRVVLVPHQHTEIVVRERITGVDLQGAGVALFRLGLPAFQLERDSAPVPRLGRWREFPREAVGRRDRSPRVSLEQV